jgi:hypothetical protein
VALGVGAIDFLDVRAFLVATAAVTSALNCNKAVMIPDNFLKPGANPTTFEFTAKTPALW